MKNIQNSFGLVSGVSKMGGNHAEAKIMPASTAAPFMIEPFMMKKRDVWD